MLTKNEINSIQLSATKKDFYQIWGELTEIADKLSERWDVSSTNESDPGIVLLKVLTAIADKLNYTVDKNILEAFMPSAAQEESMRKLCDMLGYSMKYYQSAETTATIKWVGKTDKASKCLILDDDTEISSLTIPQFTVFKNADEDVTYVTKEEVALSFDNLSAEIDVIEGEIVQCESENDNIISIANIDDNNRFYLPETQIAENGIFVYNINDGIADSEAWEKVDNLNTQSLNTKCYKFGYDSQEGLPYIQFPEDISTVIEDGLLIYFVRTNGVNGNISANTLSAISDITISKDGEDMTVSSGNFGITNKNAAINGTNLETISGAYENYKKTIGTFDTLVTCRDYMNKIYSLYDDNNLPLVSNVIVSDIRDDINKSITLCSFNEYGISYETVPLQEDGEDTIDHFTLMVYPFKTAYDSGTERDYKNSFEFSDANMNEIEIALDKYKSLSHVLELPKNDDICCIKNYLKLKAVISTTTKVNALTQKLILENIYSALYKEFNLRHLDFGDELLSDTIYETIQNADSRIKFVSLDNPEVETRIYTRNGEYSAKDVDSTKYQELMNKLIVRNILAGRVPLFNYYEDFQPEFSEKAPTGKEPVIENIEKLTSEAKISTSEISAQNPVTLLDNEVIQFSAPNFKTEKTISAYVNYYFIHNDTSTSGIAARMIYLREWLQSNWEKIYPTDENQLTKIEDVSSFGTAYTNGYVILEKSNTSYIVSSDISYQTGKTYYYYPLNYNTIANWVLKVKAVSYTYAGSQTANYAGIFESKGSDAERVAGYLIDENLTKYREITSMTSSAARNLGTLFVQNVDSSKQTYEEASGLGQDSVLATISANSEYELGDGEYLYINYTSSSTSDDESSSEEKEVSSFFGPGTIIKPNFELADSETYKTLSGKSWPKTVSTSKQFVNDKEDATESTKTLPSGHMWSLGSDEQIEIRTIDETELKPDSENDIENIYVYWETNDGRTNFFGSEPEIVLGENEYFFLTDADKSGLVYYGNGTVVKKTGNIVLSKNSKNTVELSDILEYGIDALSDVWVKTQTSKTNYITLQSRQFINLTSGDKLLTLVGMTGSTLENKPKTCTSATYILNGTESSLPAINVSDYKWSVRSRLEFNMGPNLTQKLCDSRDVISYDGTEISGDSANPIAIKANYLCQSSADTINVADLLDEDAGEPFRLSLFEIDEVKCTIGSYSEAIPMNNFGNKWTKFSFSQFTKNLSETGNAAINLNVKTPGSGYFAMLMIYYVQADASKYAYLTLEDSTKSLSVYNLAATNTWWEGLKDGNNYKLKPGMNVIRLASSNTITLHNVNDDDAFIISPLDIVKTNNVDGVSDRGLNLSLLQYKSTTTDSDAVSLLAMLRDYDPEHRFYYNNILESSKTININSDLDENLLSPNCWYDYNNVNNKFVVCEIDSDYMKNGITIANSSKLK